DPTPIFPLDEAVGDLLFGAHTLRALVDEAAAANGLDVVDIDPDEMPPAGTAVVVDADVVVNAAALRALLAAAPSSGIVQAAIAPGTPLFTASTRLLDIDTTQPLRVPLWAGTFTSSPKSDDRSTNVVVIAHETGRYVVDVRPYGPAPHQLVIAEVTRLLGWPRHWVHVLDLSLAALRSTLSPLPSSTMPIKYKRGQGSPQVHPTATVVRSVLGKNVKVEAHASITDSVIGDDVLVADHTVIHDSVVGAGCRTLVDTHLRRCVAMPGSTLSNLDMQDALLGREIFLTTGVAFFHDGPGRNVVVDGIDSGRAVLAGAIGRRALLGSRALFAAGVALPAGALVVARPEESLGKLDARGLERAHMRIGDRAIDV
ncbi:MAG TPA: hypothetical protein VGF99_21930, partial [Myxococcota bacterium]